MYIRNASIFCLLFILVPIAYSSVLEKRDIDLFGRCLTDSSCKPHEYCDRDFPNPFGKCQEGHEEGKRCFMDRYCASKQCSFFSCKKRIQVKDGPCKISADCLNNQYCDDIKDRDDLRQCYDRKCTGSCSKDSQCLSDKCHFFTCVKGSSC